MILKEYPGLTVPQTFRTIEDVRKSIPTKIKQERTRTFWLKLMGPSRQRGFLSTTRFLDTGNKVGLLISAKKLVMLGCDVVCMWTRGNVKASEVPPVTLDTLLAPSPSSVVSSQTARAPSPSRFRSGAIKSSWLTPCSARMRTRNFSPVRMGSHPCFQTSLSN